MSLGAMASPAGKSVKEALLDPDLVLVENAGITFDRLHQRAGFTLLGGAALAGYRHSVPI